MKTISVVSLVMLFSAFSAAFGDMYGNPGSAVNAEPVIPEHVEIRKAYAGLIFAPMNEVLEFPETTVVQPFTDNRVRIQTRKQQDSFYLLFTNEEDFKFPLYSQGSYIIKRNIHDGSFVQVKIFIRSDPGSFVRIFPQGDRSSMDLYLYGYPVYRNVNLPLPFESVLSLPVAFILKSTAQSLDWSLITSPPFFLGQQRVKNMADAVRAFLPGLPDLEDGAMDFDGSFRLIEDLSDAGPGGFNCSGFAKWVVDGLYYEQHGTYMSIEELKKKPVHIRGNRWSNRFEDERDPYFGLDWTRNLAAAVQGGGPPENWDIRDIPYFQYIEDMGYPMDHLPFILYYLAHEKPGYFYLASINSEYGNEPMLRQHFHVAVFFPYFDENGEFHAAVMERNMDTPVDQFVQRYPDDYIHLVQIKAPKIFNPPEIPLQRQHEP